MGRRMTWALTPWGIVCKRIADAFVAEYPMFSIGIGPDDDDLIGVDQSEFADRGHRLTFVILDGTITDPKRGGNDETYGTFDEVLPLQIQLRVPTDLDAQTNHDKSPVLAESAKEYLLYEIDAIRHTQWLIPRAISRRGGRIGEYGTVIIIMCNLRLENSRPAANLSPVVSVDMGLTVTGPDGNGETIEVTDAP